MCASRTNVIGGQATSTSCLRPWERFQRIGFDMPSALRSYWLSWLQQNPLQLGPTRSAAAHAALNERALEAEMQPCPGGTRVLAWLNTFHLHWFCRV